MSILTCSSVLISVASAWLQPNVSGNTQILSQWATGSVNELLDQVEVKLGQDHSVPAELSRVTFIWDPSASGKDLQQAIAIATSGKWVSEKNGLRLVISPEAKRAATERVRKDRVDAIQHAFGQLPKRFDPETDARLFIDRILEATPSIAANQSYRYIADRLLHELCEALGADWFSNLDEYGLAVLSSEPRGTEKPFPVKAQKALENYLAFEEALAKSFAKVPESHPAFENVRPLQESLSTTGSERHFKFRAWIGRNILGTRIDVFDSRGNVVATGNRYDTLFLKPDIRIKEHLLQDALAPESLSVAWAKAITLQSKATDEEQLKVRNSLDDPHFSVRSLLVAPLLHGFAQRPLLFIADDESALRAARTVAKGQLISRQEMGDWCRQSGLKIDLIRDRAVITPLNWIASPTNVTAEKQLHSTLLGIARSTYGQWELARDTAKQGYVACEFFGATFQSHVLKALRNIGFQVPTIALADANPLAVQALGLFTFDEFKSGKSGRVSSPQLQSVKRWTDQGISYVKAEATSALNAQTTSALPAELQLQLSTTSEPIVQWRQRGERSEVREWLRDGVHPSSVAGHLRIEGESQSEYEQRLHGFEFRIGSREFATMAVQGDFSSAYFARVPVSTVWDRSDWGSIAELPSQVRAMIRGER